MKLHTSPTAYTPWINPLSKTVVVIVVYACLNTRLKLSNKCKRKFALVDAIKVRPNTLLTSILDGGRLPRSAAVYRSQSPQQPQNKKRCGTQKRSVALWLEKHLQMLGIEPRLLDLQTHSQVAHRLHYTDSRPKKIDCKTSYTSVPTRP
jgi:hypothetical protein